tara:strand:- start:1428 stop:1943 length:516 start_codon:yes stop_codon:yes gene_type:complete
MAMYKYLRKLWKKPKAHFGKEAWKEWMTYLRARPAFERIDKPTRLDRARSLGYKAKQGIIVVRGSVTKGTTKRPKFAGGRRPKRYARRGTPAKSKQAIIEMRAARKYPNLEVLNSYWVGEDGKRSWYEIIMIDRSHPSILADKQLGNVVSSKGRVYRGLTSAGKRSRGLVR